MQETKFTSHEQYLFGRLFSIKAKKTCTDKSTLQAFYSVQIETTHKPSKVAAAKIYFFSVYVIDATCFDECFLIHVITGRRFFSKSLLLL